MLDVSEIWDIIIGYTDHFEWDPSLIKNPETGKGKGKGKRKGKEKGKTKEKSKKGSAKSKKAKKGKHGKKAKKKDIDAFQLIAVCKNLK